MAWNSRILFLIFLVSFEIGTFNATVSNSTTVKTVEIQTATTLVGSFQLTESYVNSTKHAEEKANQTSKSLSILSNNETTSTVDGSFQSTENYVNGTKYAGEANQTSESPVVSTKNETTCNESFAQLSSSVSISPNETARNVYNSTSTFSNSTETTFNTALPSGPFDRTLSEKELKKWIKVTPGFIAEEVCVVKRGLWRSNLKLSPNETWVNDECNILYCNTDGTIRSYSCTFLNSTMVQRHNADIKINESIEKCRKAYCLAGPSFSKRLHSLFSFWK